MKIGILGTGIVGSTIGTKLIQLGHEVKMGSRNPGNEKAVKWVESNGENASESTFFEAAAFGKIIFNCTKGEAVLNALSLAGEENLRDKILADVSNPLDFSKGMPPVLSIVNDNSLAEEIQKAYPRAKVVKTLNTMSASVMVNPALVPGDHNVFMSGNDETAKHELGQLLQSFGWKEHNIIDLGDITTARGTEQLLPVWLRLWGKFKSPLFNFHIAKSPAIQ